jgi:hypothetical protein
MLTEIVGSINPVRASVGLDNVTGVFVRGIPLTIKTESRAGTMNPTRNTETESVRERTPCGRIQREAVGSAIGLGVRGAIRQAVRTHVAHAAESNKNDFLHSWASPVFGVGHFPICSETGLLPLNSDSPRSGVAAVAGVPSVIQHFLQGLHMKEIIHDG